MSNYWIGFFTIPTVLAVGALTLTVLAGGLRLWFHYGHDLVSLVPERIRDRHSKSSHAAVIANSEVVVRILWLAGTAVYVTKHGPFGDRAQIQRTLGAIDKTLKDN
ncbi:membrane protein [Gordonia Phage Boohoo]|nr:membrane protein [Gordonia Phage Boohoo]UVD39786.1 membrane protein [Gordonia phage Anaysia]